MQVLTTMKIIPHGNPSKCQNNFINKNLERDLSLSDYDLPSNIKDYDILQMILSIQTTILKFIKNSKN